MALGQSQKRVLNAFERVKSDRVPVNYMANAGIDRQLKTHFGLSAHDDDELLNILDVDFRHIGPSYQGPVLHRPLPDRPEVRVDPLTGIRTRLIEHASGNYWDYCDFPLEFAGEEEVAAWPFSDPDDYDYSGIEEQIKAKREYATAFACYGDYINGNGMLRGMEQTLVDLVTDEPAGLLLAKRRFEQQTGIIERVLHHGKGGIDILWLGEDLGTQIGQMISLDLFRKHIKPLFQIIVDIGKHYGTRIMIHTCGSSSWAYEDFIEMGIDAVDTLQPEAKDMAPQHLVDTFGGRLSFHGYISTAGTLAEGTPAEQNQTLLNRRHPLRVKTIGNAYTKL